MVADERMSNLSGKRTLACAAPSQSPSRRRRWSPLLPSVKIADPLFNGSGLARLHTDHRTVMGIVSAPSVSGPDSRVIEFHGAPINRVGAIPLLPELSGGRDAS